MENDHEFTAMEKSIIYGFLKKKPQKYDALYEWLPTLVVSFVLAMYGAFSQSVIAAVLAYFTLFFIILGSITGSQRSLKIYYEIFRKYESKIDALQESSP